MLCLIKKKVLMYNMNGPQGWRISMEDAHTHILTLAEDKDAAFFAGNIWPQLRTFPSPNLRKPLVLWSVYYNIINEQTDIYDNSTALQMPMFNDCLTNT